MTAPQIAVDVDELAELCREAADVPSPTGSERALADLLAARATAAGLRAEVQHLGDDRANVVIRVGEGGGGGRLLLLAPIDTAFAPGELGSHPRADFDVPARRDGELIVGLGAENPKAYAACALATAMALHRSGRPLPGELTVGLVGGTMPTLCRTPGGQALGLGAGTEALIAGGVRPDAAVVLKPGWAVVHSEVGYAFLRVTVGGALGYTGSRHKGVYRNPIAPAAALVLDLERWFADYSRRHRGEQVAPQGAVTGVSAAVADRPAFSPATCELTVDLRIPPGSDVNQIVAEFTEVVRASVANGYDAAVEVIAAQPGSATPPSHWIAGALTGALAAVEGGAAPAAKPGSGISDGGVLRRHGIPAVRIGFPPPGPTGYPGFSMGVAELGSMRRLTEVLLRVAVEACTTPREVVRGITEQEPS